MKGLVTILVFMLSISSVYGQTDLATEKKGGKRGIQLKIEASSGMIMQVQEKGEDGKTYWGPPSEGVLFADDLAKRHAIRATVGDTTMLCLLRAQDVAYIIENGKRNGRVSVSWYEGCPFEITEVLSVRSDMEMRIEKTIEIERADDNILFLSKTSSRPIIFHQGKFYIGCETFRNMVWLFKKKGIQFRAGTDKYLVKKDGATIKFSSEGINMDGIEKVE